MASSRVPGTSPKRPISRKRGRFLALASLYAIVFRAAMGLNCRMCGHAACMGVEHKRTSFSDLTASVQCDRSAISLSQGNSLSRGLSSRR